VYFIIYSPFASFSCSDFRSIVSVLAVFVRLFCNLVFTFLSINLFAILSND
jgi:hypothetical protein